MQAAQLDAFVAQQLGAAVQRRSSVGGGCIHSAWRLQLADGRQVFAKTNRAAALPLLQAELEGLRALARFAPPTLLLPEPLALGSAGDQAVLLLSWLELAGSPSDARGDGWAALGGALAELHRASSEAAPSAGFGFATGNFIGASHQANGWLPAWPRFFVQRRLAPQLAMAEQSGTGFTGAEALLGRVAQRLEGHACRPSLVHGDLWSGNAGLLASTPGQPLRAALFDPAAYWGDREVDLAMARLFGGFPKAFFAGYQARWPLPPGWRERVEFYNLYHLLNHANQFGGGYHRQAQASIDRLMLH